MVLCSVPAGVPGAGWGQQWSAHCGDLGHASTSRRVQQPAQHRTAGSLLHLQDYVHTNYIIMLLLLSTGRSLQSGSHALVLVYSVQCCPWSEFSDIMHDTVQALWYNGTCAQSALDTHASHQRASHTPNKGQGGQTH